MGRTVTGRGGGVEGDVHAKGMACLFDSVSGVHVHVDAKAEAGAEVTAGL